MIKQIFKTIYKFIPIPYKIKLICKKKFINLFPLAYFGYNTFNNYLELRLLINFYYKKSLSKIKTNPTQMKNLKLSQLKKTAKSLCFPFVEKPLVSILIPVYNNIKLTLECLHSINENSKTLNYEIIIIDDASKDETQQFLSSMKGIIYLRNNQNLGFLRSCNLGLQRIRTPYVVILNNDVQVTKNWLNSLLDTFYLYPDTGAAGPKILFPDGRLQEAGAKINYDGTTQLIGIFDDPNKARYNYIRTVDYCSACCLMIKTDVIEKAGVFDISFAPAYCEDVDLCLRIQKLNLKIRYNPNSIIIHHLNATMKTTDKNKNKFSIRNQQKLFLSWNKEIDKLNNTKLIAFLQNQNKFESIEEEIKLAKRHNIYGFAINLNFINELIVDNENILKISESDFPFCFSLEKINKLFHSNNKFLVKELISFFKKANYITIKGMPLLIINQVNSLEILKDFTQSIRKAFGIKKIFLAYKTSSELALNNRFLEDYGFDFIISNSETQIPFLLKNHKKIILNKNIFPFSNLFISIKITSFQKITSIFYQIMLEDIIKLSLIQNENYARIVFIESWNDMKNQTYLTSHEKNYFSLLEATKNALDQNYLLIKSL